MLSLFVCILHSLQNTRISIVMSNEYSQINQNISANQWINYNWNVYWPLGKCNMFPYYSIFISAVLIANIWKYNVNIDIQVLHLNLSCLYYDPCFSSHLIALTVYLIMFQYISTNNYFYICVCIVYNLCTNFYTVK